MRFLLRGLTSPARHEAQVRFVNEGRGVKGLARRFAGQLLRRQLAQLVVDQWQELTGRVRIALVDGV
jgi:hypothetical protein